MASCCTSLPQQDVARGVHSAAGQLLPLYIRSVTAVEATSRGQLHQPLVLVSMGCV